MSIERLKTLIDLLLALNSEIFLDASTLSERVPYMSKSSLYHTLEKWISKKIVIKKERTETPAGEARADFRLSDKGKEILNSIIIKFPEANTAGNISKQKKSDQTSLELGIDTIEFDSERIENMVMEISDDMEHLLTQDAMKDFQLILDKKLKKFLL